MQATFAIIAALTLVSAIAAMSLRNLVHCALCLAAAFAGLAAMYLQLGAQFVGFAQILVYIGAVAILVVFAILLTRSGQPVPHPVVSRSWIVGVLIAALVFGVLAKVIISSSVVNRSLPQKDGPTVREIGAQLMTWYVLPLQVIGLVLTAATIGAVIIAMHERPEERKTRPGIGERNVEELSSSGSLNVPDIAATTHRMADELVREPHDKPEKELIAK